MDRTLRSGRAAACSPVFLASLELAEPFAPSPFSCTRRVGFPCTHVCLCYFGPVAELLGCAWRAVDRDAWRLEAVGIFARESRPARAELPGTTAAFDAVEQGRTSPPRASLRWFGLGKQTATSRRYLRPRSSASRSSTSSSSPAGASSSAVVRGRLSRHLCLDQGDDLVGLRIATEHRFREHERPVDVHVEDPVRARYNLDRGEVVLVVFEQSGHQTDGLRRRTSGDAVLDSDPVVGHARESMA